MSLLRTRCTASDRYGPDLNTYFHCFHSTLCPFPAAQPILCAGSFSLKSPRSPTLLQTEKCRSYQLQTLLPRLVLCQALFLDTMTVGISEPLTNVVSAIQSKSYSDWIGLSELAGPPSCRIDISLPLGPSLITVWCLPFQRTAAQLHFLEVYRYCSVWCSSCSIVTYRNTVVALVSFY